MLYDVMTISVQPGSPAQALAKLEGALGRLSLRGELLTCWLSEIGALNRILLIRGYTDINALETDRQTIVEIVCDTKPDLPEYWKLESTQSRSAR